MREAVVRDRNHPSIIAWVAFNETWGLGKPEDYKKDRDTQEWVGQMVDAIRELDGRERLVEDNSPCNYDHIANTDLNSWHFYIDNHDEARRHIEDVVAKTKPGSGFNYCPGLAQSSLPLINSEYGAVSAGGGDRDISWGLRDLTTQLRRHRKIQGFVYTELDRHRVGAQRAGQLRSDAQGVRLRHLAARHAAQRAPGRRLHRLRRAAGDRRQARRDGHGPDLRQPLFRPPGAGQGAVVGQRLRCASRHPVGRRARDRSRSRGRPYDVVSSWSRSSSRCRTIRWSGRC